MVKRNATAPEEEPTQGNFKKPSEGIKHLFQVVDIISEDGDIVVVRLEVSGGKEEGRSVRHRVDCDPDGKGFWATRLFLKAVKEPYKGEISIDSDNWIGREFRSDVVHNPDKNDASKVYANLGQYEYDEYDEQKKTDPKLVSPTNPTGAVAWDE